MNTSASGQLPYYHEVYTFSYQTQGICALGNVTAMDETGTLDGVIKLLRHRDRRDLAELLQRAWLELDESNPYGSYLFSTLTTARIHAPIEDYERLRNLSDSDQNEILRTLLEIHPPREHSIEITHVEFVVDTSTPTRTHEDLIKEIEAQRSLMIAVATGGPRIQSVNADYQSRRDPNPPWWVYVCRRFHADP